ncbi:hypothetical protein [Deinococcus sp. Leaf326]|uniref:hypothetical protein n=1 Tax=Deinococcus sp. Leaf326 TaxID=1736338 RepID=UPI0012E25356|nr:hypothetical protein [Deinococcus sp. Leaf326]
MYNLIIASELVSLLGNFTPELKAITYSAVDEEWTIPETGGFIVFSIDGNTPRASESAVTSEDVVIKFFISGDNDIEIEEQLVKLLNGVSVGVYYSTYLGTNTVPKSPQNTKSALTARFKLN